MDREADQKGSLKEERKRQTGKEWTEWKTACGRDLEKEEGLVSTHTLI